MPRRKTENLLQRKWDAATTPVHMFGSDAPMTAAEFTAHYHSLCYSSQPPHEVVRLQSFLRLKCTFGDQQTIVRVSNAVHDKLGDLSGLDLVHAQLLSQVADAGLMAYYSRLPVVRRGGDCKVLMSKWEHLNTAHRILCVRHGSTTGVPLLTRRHLKVLVLHLTGVSIDSEDDADSEDGCDDGSDGGCDDGSDGGCDDGSDGGCDDGSDDEDSDGEGWSEDERMPASKPLPTCEAYGEALRLAVNEKLLREGKKAYASYFTKICAGAHSEIRLPSYGADIVSALFDMWEGVGYAKWAEQFPRSKVTDSGNGRAAMGFVHRMGRRALTQAVQARLRPGYGLK